MSVSRLARLLGGVPATASRAASKTPGPGAEVAGGVTRPRCREKVLPQGSRVCPGLLKAPRATELLFFRLGHPRLGPGRVPSPSRISGVGLGLDHRTQALPAWAPASFRSLVRKGSKTFGVVYLGALSAHCSSVLVK